MKKDLQYYKFCAYGFLKNLRFFDPFLLIYLLSMEVSLIQIGSLFAYRQIMTNILEIPTGVVADFSGRKKSLIFSFISYILSFLILLMTSNIILLFLSFTVFSLGEAFRTGTHKAIILHYLRDKGWENEKLRYYGKTRGWSQLGSALNAVIAGAFVFIFENYRPVVALSIVPYFLDLLLVASYPSYMEGDLNKQKLSLVKRFSLLMESIKQGSKNKRQINLMFLTGIGSGLYKAMKEFLQPLLKGLTLSLPFFLGWSESRRVALLIGITYTLLHLISSLGANKAQGWNNRHKSAVNSLFFAVVLSSGAGALSAVFFNTPWPFLGILFMGGIYFLENLRKPIGISVISKEMPSETMASGLSLQSQIESLTAAILTYTLGVVSHNFGLITGFITTSLGVLGISLILYLFIKRA